MNNNSNYLSRDALILSKLEIILSLIKKKYIKKKG